MHLRTWPVLSSLDQTQALAFCVHSVYVCAVVNSIINNTEMKKRDKNGCIQYFAGKVSKRILWRALMFHCLIQSLIIESIQSASCSKWISGHGI